METSFDDIKAIKIKIQDRKCTISNLPVSFLDSILNGAALQTYQSANAYDIDYWNPKPDHSTVSNLLWVEKEQRQINLLSDMLRCAWNPKVEPDKHKRNEASDESVEDWFQTFYVNSSRGDKDADAPVTLPVLLQDGSHASLAKSRLALTEVLRLMRSLVSNIFGLVSKNAHHQPSYGIELVEKIERILPRIKKNLKAYDEYLKSKGTSEQTPIEKLFR